MCVLKWNKRGSFQKTTIYYSMLNKRGIFRKTTCVHIEMKQEGQFSKKNNNQFITVCYSTCMYWNETRGTVLLKTTIYYSMLFTKGAFFKGKFISIYWTVWYSTCVRIEMKQEGQFSKKTTTIYYSMLFNKRGIFQKTTIYYCMIFNLCAYWNETRGDSFQKQRGKKHQFITVCLCPYSTCMHIEVWNKIFKKQQFSKKSYWNETRGTVFKNITMTICY